MKKEMSGFIYLKEMETQRLNVSAQNVEHTIK